MSPDDEYGSYLSTVSSKHLHLKLIQSLNVNLTEEEAKIAYLADWVELNSECLCVIHQSMQVSQQFSLLIVAPLDFYLA